MYRSNVVHLFNKKTKGTLWSIYSKDGRVVGEVVLQLFLPSKGLLGINDKIYIWDCSLEIFLLSSDQLINPIQALCLPLFSILLGTEIAFFYPTVFYGSDFRTLTREITLFNKFSSLPTLKWFAPMRANLNLELWEIGSFMISQGSWYICFYYTENVSTSKNTWQTLAQCVDAILYHLGLTELS